MLRGTTPAAPDDRGEADPELAEALAAGELDRIAPAVLRARLLVPVVAEPGSGDAEMSVPALVAASGLRALPVFSSYDALRAWQADARPVPMAGARVFAAAGAEGYAGIVLDVAGPTRWTFTDSTLETLAAAARTLLAHPDAAIRIVAEDFRC